MKGQACLFLAFHFLKSCVQRFSSSSTSINDWTRELQPLVCKQAPHATRPENSKIHLHLPVASSEFERLPRTPCSEFIRWRCLSMFEYDIAWLSANDDYGSYRNWFHDKLNENHNYDLDVSARNAWMDVSSRTVQARMKLLAAQSIQMRLQSESQLWECCHCIESNTKKYAEDTERFQEIDRGMLVLIQICLYLYIKCTTWSSAISHLISSYFIITSFATRQSLLQARCFQTLIWPCILINFLLGFMTQLQARRGSENDVSTAINHVGVAWQATNSRHFSGCPTSHKIIKSIKIIGQEAGASAK